MPDDPPRFDARRLAHFMALMDSPSDGEAQSALMQARFMLHKAGLHLVDALETDAYLDAMTRQVKPRYSRTANSAELQRLREACQQLAAERDRLCQAGQEMVEELERLETAYNALAGQVNAQQQATRAHHRPWPGRLPPGGARPALGMLCLCLLFAGGQWWSTRAGQGLPNGDGLPVGRPGDAGAMVSPAVRPAARKVHNTDTTIPNATTTAKKPVKRDK